MVMSLVCRADAKRRAFRAITQLISRHGSRRVFACVRTHIMAMLPAMRLLRHNRRAGEGSDAGWKINAGLKASIDRDFDDARQSGCPGALQSLRQGVDIGQPLGAD